MQMNKYQLRCVSCGYITPNFQTWFSQNQICPRCGSKHSEVNYFVRYAKLLDLFKEEPRSFWHYFDFLPLYNKENIVSCNEGAIPLERWDFLENFAKEKHGLDIQIHVYRNDLNGGTGTFKDIGASLAASLFKENGIEQYCIASTGNTATAYGKYLAMAGVDAAIFMPENAEQLSQAEIASYGQQVFRITGDYTHAKKVAADYSLQRKVLISAGNIDPIRVESKRTMVFEWLRLLGRMPDVYVQAISGGTGPLALDKAVRELQPYRSVELPRMLMVQTDRCDPMVQAWESAKEQNFPEGFEQNYPIIENPQTSISILATGNPATYPLIAKLMLKCNGNFIRVAESKVLDMARLVAFERKIHIGPASAVCLLGLLNAIENKEIADGQTVLVNMGEGIKRAPDFLNQFSGRPVAIISSADQCRLSDKKLLRERLWENVFAAFP
jgi:threonine synthase